MLVSRFCCGCWHSSPFSKFALFHTSLPHLVAVRSALGTGLCIQSIPNLLCCALDYAFFHTLWQRHVDDRYAGLLIFFFFYFFFLFSPFMLCFLCKDWSIFKFCTFASHSSRFLLCSGPVRIFFFLHKQLFFFLNQAPQLWTVFQEGETSGSCLSMKWINGNLNVNPHPTGSCLPPKLCLFYVRICYNYQSPNNLWKIVLSWCAIKLKDLWRVSWTALLISL